jgi:mannose-6-phosphate isomerase
VTGTVPTMLDASTRPWGSYQVLRDEADHKVKVIVVQPRKRLSLQQHARRSEHWFVVRGSGVVTIGDELREVTAGSSVDIACGAQHRVENTGDEELVFVEVQTGDYFGEDDIIRFEDDFGRV